MFVIALAFASSLLFGFSDYLGAVASRSARVISVTTLSYLTAALAYAVAFAFVPSEWSTTAIAYGLAAGVAGVFGFVTFYAALASGPISLISPMIALVQTIVPVLVGVTFRGEVLGPLAWVGIGLSLAGGWMMGFTGRVAGRIPPRSVVLALVAGTLFGLSVVVFHLSPASTGLTPGFVEVLFGFLVLGTIWAASGRFVPVARFARLFDVDPHASTESTRMTRATASTALTAGVFMGVASALILVALHAGELAIVSAVVALYPLGTVALARILLKERLIPTQGIGIVFAVAACVAFSI